MDRACSLCYGLPEVVNKTTYIEWNARDPIESIDVLSGLLGFETDTILELAQRADRMYRPFDLQHMEKWRHIDNPNEELKRLQRAIHDSLLRPVELPQGIVGGVAGRSIIDNAKIHVGKPWVVHIDIRDFFPNTDIGKVYKALEATFEFDDEVLEVLTHLTTFRRRLPQGSPSSPMLGNLVLLPLYDRVAQMCNKMNLDCSFYIDDITISGKNARDAIEPVIGFIRDLGYSVRSKKVNANPSNGSQVVTGLSVNSKVSVTRRRLESIRREIIGLAKPVVGRERELESVRGKIAFVRMISPRKAVRLEELYSRLLPEHGSEDSDSFQSGWTHACSGFRRPGCRVEPRVKRTRPRKGALVH